VAFTRRLAALLTLLGVLTGTLSQGYLACAVDHSALEAPVSAMVMEMGMAMDLADVAHHGASVDAAKNARTPDECDHPEKGAPLSDECHNALHCTVLAVGPYQGALTMHVAASTDPLPAPDAAAPSPTKAPESPPPKG
jgi:hypothetical protein